MDVVNKVIQKLDEEKEVCEKNIVVDKLIDVECFFQDFTIIDTNDLNMLEIRSDRGEDYLKELARGCVQIFTNKIANFSREVVDGTVMVNLPEGSDFGLPREKPVPTPKPLTKWQQFVKNKGLKKTKKPRATWDDILQRWVPTYGYKKAAAEKEKNWLIEVPQNKDIYTDMFSEKQKLKKENVAKNEFQRLRNIAKSKKIIVPKLGVAPKEGNTHVDQMQLAANVAKISTASHGKFQPGLPLDKKNQKKNTVGKKKKKQLIQNFKEEKERNMSMINNITKKTPKLNVQKAINKNIHEEQMTRKSEKSDNETKKHGKRKRRPQRETKKTKKQKTQKKPTSNKGKRVGKQGKGGRKRR